MVSTRLQTGAISTRKYTALSISLHDLSLSSPTSPNRPNFRKNGPRSPTKIIKPTSLRKSSRPMSPKHKSKGSVPRSSSAEMALLDTSLSNSKGLPRETPVPPPVPRRTASSRSPTATTKPMNKSKAKDIPAIPADMCPGNNVFPSAIFGAREEVGLSRIGRADREIKLWEEILVTHQQNVPDLVPIVEEKLQEARNRRACLDDTLEENLRVGDVDPAASTIKERLETLQWGLETSKFGPETENIKCAMAGYKSGAIKYTDHYTIIYAGHIIDTARTYLDFVRNRMERLDRYFALHGEGWMWYEPPLNINPESKIKAFATATLERAHEWNSLGPYHVNQGYWKRAGFVRRMAQTANSVPSPFENGFTPDLLDPLSVNCQFDGPRLSFRSMLDSGATYPSLHTEDLNALGIDVENYGAQSVELLQTANGVAPTRIFEMFVCVLDENGRQLVDPLNAVYPLSHHYLGGLCPVVESFNPIVIDSQGREFTNRLSGMVPFVACYVASTPTRDCLFFGEDRNDVLGSHRMPGQKKWSIELPIITPGMPFDRYGNPKTRFDHRDGMIVDEDDAQIEHCSNITFLKGTADEVVVVSNPAARQMDMASQSLTIDGLGVVDLSNMAGPSGTNVGGGGA